MEEATVKVVYKGLLTGSQYSTGAYTLDAGDEYEMPASEAARLLTDFGPEHFVVEGLPAAEGGKEEVKSEPSSSAKAAPKAPEPKSGKTTKKK